MNPITAYLEAIQSGQIVTGKRVRKIYERLQHDIENPGEYVFDLKAALKPISFIETFCRHSKGEWAGQPVKLELFQKAYIAALFGFLHRDTGYRRFRESLFLVARKNGKSTLLSALALYCMIADGEPGAEIYSVATKKDQASIVFSEVLNMVKQSAELGKILRKRKSDLWCEMSFSKMQPLGRNSDSLDGLNAHLVIVDELHSIRDRNLYEVMKQSQSARRQPLLVMITTAGSVRECIFDDMRKYAIGVVDGTIKDDTFLPVLYELDAKSEWKDPAMWPKANPSLGAVKKVEDLKDKIARAKQSPNDLRGVLCKDLNVISTSASAWLTYDAVNNEETFNLLDFSGSYFIGGADLSITTDLTCASALMIDKQGKIYVQQMYWLPEANFQKRVQEEKLPYDRWLEAGLMRLCHGNSIVYSDVTAWFLELVKDHQLNPAWVYYDAYSARYWQDEMSAEGFDMVKCHQGAKTLSLPMHKLGADLKEKKINYGNNPMLKWCICNTGIVEDRNGNIVPVKAQSPKYRIDGLASLLDAYVGLCDHYAEFLNLAVYEGKK
ncbi:MAG: hypothetical protein K6G15_00050 [Desulfovibrio sp.]|nr:hypothetical protein [Desulfovibrio sp.]